MSWLVYPLIFVLGAFAGWLMARLRMPEARELETHLKEMQAKYEEYQNAVADHFINTAKMVNNLSSSYREVHTHLQQGAETLCAENRRPGGTPAITFDALTPSPRQDEDPYSIEPPRDYATKKENGRGMLHEEFGFKD
jgi:uncharacterized membrane-anchored protein YhcB (DUF1043 family)